MTQDLNIRLNLQDQFTPALAGITNTIQEVGRSMEQSGKQLSQFGTKMTFLGGAITGAFTLVAKSASEVSPEVHRVFTDMGNSMLRLQTDIAQAVLPVFQQISSAIRNVTNAFEEMNPQLRNTILQGLLIGGVFLTAVGLFIKFAGTIEFITGKLTTFITHLTKTQWTIMAIAAAVILMIQYWDKVREFVLPIVSALEVGAKTLAIGFLQVTDGIVSLVGKLSVLGDFLDVIVTIMEKTGQLPIYVAGAMHTALAGIKQNTEGVRAEIASQIAALENDITTVFETGSGKWAESFDSIMTSAQTFLNSFSGIMQNAGSSIQQFADDFMNTFNKAVVGIQNLGQQSAQIVIGQIQMLSKGFGDSIANMLVKGKNFGESMKAVFEQMAISFISGVIQMIVQWAIFQAIQAAFMPLMVSLGSAAAMALAAIWAPVAAMVSLATLGGNAGPAAAALTSTTALAYAMSIPKLGEGGIVTRPTLALIGERGPEAVVPLNRSNSYKTTNIHIEINNPNVTSREDIDTLTEEISRRLAHEVERIR